jgi:AcrR family transcriptional regulator
MREAGRLLATRDQATVEDIANAAGVSRSTFYRSFPSRSVLLRELRLEPEIGARDRILESAARLLQTESLAQLSMDELANVAGVSRANLYRLFPGKAALFHAMLLAFSPFEPVMTLFDQRGHEPPDQLIPDLVVTAYRAVAPRVGIARTLVVEITAMTTETRDAFAQTGLQAFSRLAAYLGSHMEAGRLRRMPPVLAVQALVGPVMIHVLSTPLLVESAPAPTGEDAVRQLATIWLDGMRPR